MSGAPSAENLAEWLGLNESPDLEDEMPDNETEIIDKLFLELSKVTQAQTERELRLIKMCEDLQTKVKELNEKIGALEKHNEYLRRVRPSVLQPSTRFNQLNTFVDRMQGVAANWTIEKRSNGYTIQAVSHLGPSFFINHHDIDRGCAQALEFLDKANGI